MKILNPGPEDYHIHSITFSDGWNSVDEIVKYAGDIGMTKIAICDHSAALLKADGLLKKTYRSPCKRWQNVYNDVEVIFGVEADLLNEAGDVCMEIDGIAGDFIILSYHEEVFKSNSKKSPMVLLMPSKDTTIKLTASAMSASGWKRGTRSTSFKPLTNTKSRWSSMPNILSRNRKLGRFY